MQPTLTQYVEIRENRRGEPRAFIAGSRMRVQDIASDHQRHGLSADEIAQQYPQLSLAQVHAALSYFFDNKEEVWRCITEDAQYADSMRTQLDTTLPKVSGTDANTDSVSS